MLRSGGRLLPKLRSFFLRKGNHAFSAAPVFIQREFHLPRRSDPFTQMENFIRDMEKKFWREVDNTWLTSRFPRIGEEYPVNFGGCTDLSTADQFKIIFNFSNAKAEDVKVTLKDRLLTIEGKLDQVTDTTKLHQSFSYQYTVPEDVDVHSLESLISNEGILTIQASRAQNSPRSIPITRE